MSTHSLTIAQTAVLLSLGFTVERIVEINQIGGSPAPTMGDLQWAAQVADATAWEAAVLAA